VRALQLLRRALKKRLEFMHAKTEEAMWRGVLGVLRSGQLWLTALGRGLSGETTAKHRIKAADRLLGSENLHESVPAIYQSLAHFLIGQLGRPCISIDWTGVGPHHYLLSASLSFCGRALPIFSRIFHKSQKGSPTAAREFLRQFADIVPPTCTPVLITDAGFYYQWFDQVRSLGWHFIGRLRGRVSVKLDGVWQPLSVLHCIAGRKPKCLGVVSTNRTRRREVRVVLSSRPKLKGRKNLTRKGTSRRDTIAKRTSSGAREPLVLATSLTDCGPKSIVTRYARRMQIEECFRDLKAHRYGWSLQHVRSRTPERIEVLVLLAALGIVVMHVIGLAAERARIHFNYQANTIRKRRVFSTFFLARLHLQDNAATPLAPDELKRGFARLHVMIRYASATA